MDASIKALHKNIMEWMAGPTGSVVIHVALILAAIFLVDLTIREKDQEIEVTMIELDEQELEDLEELEPPEEIPEVETVTPPDVEMDMTPPPDIEDFSAEPITDTVELDIASDAISPIIMKNLAPGAMGNRSGSGRKAAIGTYGGKWGQYAEAAVLRALEWLRINQNKDGSWGTNDKEAYAGLALLTYLAHGETSSSEKYGDTIQLAIRYLIARQNEKGEFAKTEGTIRSGGGGVYSHAICCYALSEAYGMTRIPSLKPVMEKGIQVLLDGQKDDGGWIMYSFKKGQAGPWDVSLSGFCIQALKAAYIAGAENPGLKEAMGKSAKFLTDRQREDGGFPYSAANPGRQPNMTAVSVLCLQLMGYGEEKAAKAGLRFLRDADCSWSKPEEAPIYSWYYVSQAKFHQGGASWTGWNNKFAPVLIRNQNPDGSWISPGLALKDNGVAREYRGAEINSQLYATTLSALTLQVYYRFLPTYKPISTETVDQKSDGDVQIEIF